MFFFIFFNTAFQLNSADQSFLIERANVELEKARVWFQSNKLTLNTKKTKYLIFKDKNIHCHFENLIIEGKTIDRIGQNLEERTFKFLGHMIDENLSGNFKAFNGDRNSFTARGNVRNCS